MTTHALRLVPGQDLKLSIQNFVASEKFKSGVILSSVGSLSQAHVRFASSEHKTVLPGPFEILNLNGTLSQDGVHLHINIADAKGQTTGGHLLEGCLILTTCELVIGTFESISFSRELDPQTNFKELKIT